MKQFFIRFRAEHYCQGYEWVTFERLVEAVSFEHACDKISSMKTEDWEKGTPKDFKNLTI